MDDLEEYHKLALLVSNFVPHSSARPMHIANSTKIPIGALRALFQPLDDGTVGLIPNARAVGAGADRAGSNRAGSDRASSSMPPDDDAQVLVI
jgi:hypothetical protein